MTSIYVRARKNRTNTQVLVVGQKVRDWDGAPVTWHLCNDISKERWKRLAIGNQPDFSVPTSRPRFWRIDFTPCTKLNPATSWVSFTYTLPSAPIPAGQTRTWKLDLVGPWARYYMPYPQTVGYGQKNPQVLVDWAPLAELCSIPSTVQVKQHPAVGPTGVPLSPLTYVDAEKSAVLLVDAKWTELSEDPL